MIPFYSLHIAPKQDQLYSIHFHSFPFLYFKTSKQGYLILFHSFPLLKFSPFHSIPFHSLIIISFLSIPFPYKLLEGLWPIPHQCPLIGSSLLFFRYTYWHMCGRSTHSRFLCIIIKLYPKNRRASEHALTRMLRGQLKITKL